MLQYPWEPHRSLSSDTFAGIFDMDTPNPDNLDELIRSYCTIRISLLLYHQINDVIIRQSKTH